MQVAFIPKWVNSNSMVWSMPTSSIISSNLHITYWIEFSRHKNPKKQWMWLGITMPHIKNIKTNDLSYQGVPQIETCFGPSKNAGRYRRPQRSLFQPGWVVAFESMTMEKQTKIELSTTLMPPFPQPVGSAIPILTLKKETCQTLAAWNSKQLRAQIVQLRKALVENMEGCRTSCNDGQAGQQGETKTLLGRNCWIDTVCRGSVAWASAQWETQESVIVFPQNFLHATLNSSI